MFSAILILFKLGGYLLGSFTSCRGCTLLTESSFCFVGGHTLTRLFVLLMVFVLLEIYFLTLPSHTRGRSGLRPLFDMESAIDLSLLQACHTHSHFSSEFVSFPCFPESSLDVSSVYLSSLSFGVLPKTLSSDDYHKGRSSNCATQVCLSYGGYLKGSSSNYTMKMLHIRDSHKGLPLGELP